MSCSNVIFQSTEIGFHHFRVTLELKDQRDIDINTD